MGIIDKIKSLFGKEEELPKAKEENQNTEQKTQVDEDIIKANQSLSEEKNFIEINYQNPPEIFMHARAFAGNSLSEMMRQESPEGKPTPNGYRWVKTDWTYPSFEHFTFAYKNQVFCVLVDMLVGDGHSLDEKSLNNLLCEAERNNLVPCIFPVVLSSDGEDFSPQNTQMSKKSSGWNLFHAETMQAIVPEQISDDTPTQMSEWEMLDFAVNIVTKQIEQEGGEILSLCSVSEMYPNIWFADKAGNRCWVIVERLPMSIDPKEAAKKWCEKVDYKSIEQIIHYDGFHAAVDFHSSAAILYDAQGKIIPLSKRDNESCPRYRGDGMYVCFRGLERIHIAEK